MCGFFYFRISVFTPIDFDFVRFINLIFLLFIPPSAQTLIFQLSVMRLNLIGLNILFGEYLMLKKIGDNIIVEQFCLLFMLYSNWLCAEPITSNFVVCLILLFNDLLDEVKNIPLALYWIANFKLFIKYNGILFFFENLVIIK